jgi:hypothetical protein
MGQYGEAAVSATQCFLRSERTSIRDSWDWAISQLTPSPSSRKKACPRDAYLGLCEAGLVRGIPAGKYGTPINNINGRYAVDAYKILQMEPNLKANKKMVWSRIPERSAANENGQLDVVLSLLENGLLTCLVATHAAIIRSSSNSHNSER